jgi:hypothetical protein
MAETATTERACGPDEGGTCKPVVYGVEMLHNPLP